MRVTVYRSEVAIYHRDTLRATWSEYRFADSPLVVIEREEGVSVVWSSAQAIAVEAPALSRLVEVELPSNTAIHGKRPTVVPERLRLVTPYESFGIDASSVYTMARVGLRGFKFAAPEPPAEIPEPAHLSKPVENIREGIHPPWESSDEYRAYYASQAPLDHGPLVPGLSAKESLDKAATCTRWGIRFGALGDDRNHTFLASSSLTPRGPIRSTRDLSEVASWPDVVQAHGWLQGTGLDPGKPVPIGIGYLYPSFAPIPDELPGHGVEFELSSITTARLAGQFVPPEPAPVLLPAPELPAGNSEPAEPVTRTKTERPRRERAGQLAFVFAD